MSCDQCRLNFLRDRNIVFQSNNTIVQFHQRNMRVLGPPHPTCISSRCDQSFSRRDVLVGSGPHSEFVSTEDVEHRFMCLPAIQASFLVACLLKNRHQEFVFFFLYVSHRSSRNQSLRQELQFLGDFTGMVKISVIWAGGHGEGRQLACKVPLSPKVPKRHS